MFGSKIDYWLLRPWTHKRNYATEYELDAGSPNLICDADHAVSRVKKYINRFEGRLSISHSTRYLDVGCGNGDIAIALAKLGCTNVTGIDIVPRNIDAAISASRKLGVQDRIQFICADINTWSVAKPYDAIISIEAMEHIDDPKKFLQILSRLLAPEGLVILIFGPLFHSICGDHMGGFFRVPVPWRSVIFSEQAILRLRRECFRPTDTVHRFQDIVGGLNKMRYSEFCRYVRETGWEFDYLNINPQLKRFPLFHAASRMFSKVPMIRDYTVISVYAVLRKARR